MLLSRLLRLLLLLRLWTQLGLLLHPLRLLLRPIHLRLLDAWRCLPDLRLRSLHLRLRPLWPLSRRRHYSRLALRSPILGLPALLLLRGCRQRSERLLSLGMPDLWRLGPWHLHLSPLLTSSFNLFLPRPVPFFLFLF